MQGFVAYRGNELLALSKVGSVAHASGLRFPKLGLWHASGLWVWNGELLLVMTTRIAPCWMGLGSLKWGGAAVPVERVEYTMWPVDGACGLGQIAWGVAFGDDAQCSKPMGLLPE